MLPRGKAARAHEPCCKLSTVSYRHRIIIASSHETTRALRTQAACPMPMWPGELEVETATADGPSRSQGWMQPDGLLTFILPPARYRVYKIGLSAAGHHQGPPASAEVRGRSFVVRSLQPPRPGPWGVWVTAAVAAHPCYPHTVTVPCRDEQKDDWQLRWMRL